MVKSVLFIEYKPGHEDDMVSEIKQLYQFLEVHIRHSDNDAIAFLDSKNEETAEAIAHQLNLHWAIDQVTHCYITNEVKSDFTHLSDKKQLAVFVSNLKAGDEEQGANKIAGFDACRDVLFINGPNNVLITGEVSGVEEAWKLGHDLPRQVRYLGHTETYVMARSHLRD